MKRCQKLTLFLVLLAGCLSTQAQNEPFTVRVVNPGYKLNSAWEVTYGPDDSLWVTESQAYKVSKLDPVTGNIRTLLDLNSNKNFTNPPKWPQGGLMGLVLHPTMYSEWNAPSKPYVYLAYVYQYNASTGCANGSEPCNFKTKIVRYTYNRTNHSLSNETVITQDLNGSNDHNSGRLAIGLVSGQPYLFYTIGDMGAGQFNNSSRTNNAQNTNVPEGKVLRFNLEPDGDAVESDKWIPNDNPFVSGGKATAVWTLGHRNAQGIVFGSNGYLYSSEQQDKSDDEVNIIEKGRNYGWPKVSGYCDGNYTNQTLAGQNVGNEITNCQTLNVKEPIYTLFTDPNPGNIGGSNMFWPTVACSSIDIYEKNAIPNWKASLLVPGLKSGTIIRLKLSADGKSIMDSSTVPVMRNVGRFRDLAIAPDGIRIYAACDMNGSYLLANGTSSSGAGIYAGRILEFTYTGTVMAINDSVNSYTRNTEVQIFPNPATSVLQVQSIKNMSKPLHWFLYDAAGKLVLNGKSNSDFFNIKVGSLTKGIYILKIKNGYNINIHTEKVIGQ